MTYLFSYTECEAPGPFQSRAGFKVKSLSTPQGSVVDAEVEKILNSTIANFPDFTAPKVDPFASREEFLALTKSWSYSPIVSGHFAFVRLATSGTKMGRPGNPFHQALVVKYAERSVLIEHAKAEGLGNLTPADFYLWNWPSPRGDAEVEAAKYSEHELPIPAVNQYEISDRFEQAFQEDPGLGFCRQFEAMWLSGSAKYVESSEADFFALLSMCLRLVPEHYAWTLQFATQPPRIESGDFDPDLVGGLFLAADQVEYSDQGVFWTELLELVVDNGLTLEVAELVQFLAGVFNFSVRTGRQALAFMPLACMMLPDPLNLLGESGIRALAWEALSAIDVKMEFRNSESSQVFENQVRGKVQLEQLPSSAQQWIRDLR